MKRLFISLAIFATLFGFAFYGTVALSHEGERLTALLTEAIDLAEMGNADGAKQAAERLEARYIESEKRLSYFVDHRNIGNSTNNEIKKSRRRNTPSAAVVYCGIVFARGLYTSNAVWLPRYFFASHYVAEMGCRAVDEVDNGGFCAMAGGEKVAQILRLGERGEGADFDTELTDVAVVDEVGKPLFRFDIPDFQPLGRLFCAVCVAHFG